MSRLKEEIQKRGFHWTTLTRDEIEDRLPDYCRFRNPEKYLTEEDQKYFRSEENLKLFKKLHIKKNN